jgi:hypothetical protein
MNASQVCGSKAKKAEIQIEWPGRGRKEKKEMKRLLVLIFVAVVALSFSIPVHAADATANLMTGGRNNPIDIGDLNITYIYDGFNVEYNIDSPWEIVDTHAYIGLTPPTKSFPAKFPFKAGYIPFYTGTATSVFIATYAEVRTQVLNRFGNPRYDRHGKPIYEYRTVWAQNGADTRIGKGVNKATYFEFVLPSPN